MYLISTFSNADLSGSIYYDRDCRKFTIKGKFHVPGAHKVCYKAAAPADLRLSYSGSGLPFANPDQAYFDTPNKGTFQTHSNGAFDFQLWAPNSYYVCNGVIDFNI